MASLNNILLIVCVVLHLLSLSFIWLFAIETRQGCAPDEYAVYKNHWSFLFWASLIIEIVLWLTMPDMQKNLEMLFALSTLIWLVSTVVFFVLSLGKSVEKSIKHNMRFAMRLAAINVIILCVFTWLFNV